MVPTVAKNSLPLYRLKGKEKTAVALTKARLSFIITLHFALCLRLLNLSWNEKKKTKYTHFLLRSMTPYVVTLSKWKKLLCETRPTYHAFLHSEHHATYRVRTWVNCNALLTTQTRCRRTIACLRQKPCVTQRHVYCKRCIGFDTQIGKNWLYMRSISSWTIFRSSRGCSKYLWDIKWSSSSKCKRCYTISALFEFYGPQDSVLCSPHFFRIGSSMPWCYNPVISNNA